MRHLPDRILLLVLGAMHFFNIFVFTRMRKRREIEPLSPPVPPLLKAGKGE